MLVTLVSSLKSLLVNNSSQVAITGNALEHHAVRLVLTALVVKILLTTNFDDADKMSVDDDDEDLVSTFEMVNIQDESDTLIKLATALNVSTGRLTPSEIWDRVRDNCKSFLIHCVTYFHLVTDIPVPTELTKVEGKTFENMCGYLGLPDTYSELFASEKVIDLAVEWSKHPGMANNREAIGGHLKENAMVDLPKDYSELLIRAAAFKCPNSNDEPSMHPALCLVCGEMICSSCGLCRVELDGVLVGACNYHTSKCGAGIGTFLRVRECDVMVVRYPSRSLGYIFTPYVDDFGEVDRGLRQGYLLKLSDEVYRAIDYLRRIHWLDAAVIGFGGETSTGEHVKLV